MLRPGDIAKHKSQTYTVASDRWEIRMILTWEDHGVRIPLDPCGSNEGFGRRLIERALPHDLNAATQFDFNSRWSALSDRDPCQEAPDRLPNDAALKCHRRAGSGGHRTGTRHRVTPRTRGLRRKRNTEDAITTHRNPHRLCTTIRKGS